MSSLSQGAAARLVEISDLSIGFTGKQGTTLPVLRNINLQVQGGETLGLVGESGSGKSTLALAAMGYLKRGLRVLGGGCYFAGDEMFSLSRTQLEHVRGGRIALIPQNSGQSLTPTLPVGAQVVEALRLHSEISDSDHNQRTIELLTQVRLPEPETLVDRYPHELSGGQQQRVAIAMALAGEPEVLLLDEPTTGLDVTTQAHILELLRDLAAATRMAMVYVSHDLGAIARVCDSVAVMYAGEIVLQGGVRQVLRNPMHPYARGLLASIPRLREASLPLALDGRPPAPGETGNSCAFAARCALAAPLCLEQRPALLPLGSDRTSDTLVRCHLSEQVNSLPMSAASVSTQRIIDSHNAPVVELRKLAISYARPGWVDQLLGRQARQTPTVNDISLTVRKGETLGLVGESGSGKSTILKAVAGLLAPLQGDVLWHGKTRLPATVENRRPEQLRQVQIVFQNPDESLNPRQSVADILAQPLTLYFGFASDALHERSVELLERVRLSAHYLDRLPGQLSGGEKQRVAIARAFAAQPELVLCDEVTSALDVSVQAAVLDLLNELRNEHNTSYIFVSHDLAVVRALSDRVAVLYQGRLCEVGAVQDVYAQPSHPYTEVLLGAVLEPDSDIAPVLMTDDVVELSPPEHGCPFQRRCPVSPGSVCQTDVPPWRHGDNGHSIRCHIDVFSTNYQTDLPMLSAQ